MENIIFGGKYPGDKEEIIRVFPIYQTLEKGKKIEILKLVIKWAEEELSNLSKLDIKK
jgi:hypothetical protein